MAAATAPALLLLWAATATLAQPAPPAGEDLPRPAPGDLVPQEVPPDRIAPDPRITVPERIIPAPPGSGAEVPMPPASSGGAPAEAVVPRGGGDPGILAPLPGSAPKAGEEGSAPRRAR